MDIFDRLASNNEYNDWESLIPKKLGTANSENGSLSNNNASNIPLENIASEDVFDRLSKKEEQKKENEFGFLDTLRDIGEQITTKGFSGAAGSYGNILETVGLNPRIQSESEQNKNKREFDILSKLESGNIPSYGEFLELSGDEPTPRYQGLPTSKEIQSKIKETTGIGEGKTSLGRIAGRGAEMVGEGAALPGGGVRQAIGLGLGGLAGQTVRETGGPEALATGLEIAGGIAPSVITKQLAPLTKSGKDIVEAGRKLGLAEKGIAPLLQGEAKLATIAPLAKKGTRTKKVFENIKERLGDSYERIKNSKEAKARVPIKERVNLLSGFSKIRNDLAKTLSPSPEKEAALKYIDTALGTLTKQEITPEHLINFWQDINKSVNWNSISGGKKALSRLKNPVSDTLKKISPNLASDFELTNDLYSKYAKISKRLKPDIVDSFVNKGELLAYGPAAIGLATGNPWVLGGLAGETGLRLLAREMLINPYFQTLAGKLVTNINGGSIKAIETTVNQAKEFLTKKYPEEDWSFLNNKEVS